MAEGGGGTGVYEYTVVLLEGAPPFSDNTSQEMRQKTLLQFGYRMGLTNIVSVSVVKGQAVYKLYGGSEIVLNKTDNVHILYQLTISDKVTVKLSEPKAELVSIVNLESAYKHLIHDGEDGLVIVGPPESVIAFCDLLNEQCVQAILPTSLTDQEIVSSGKMNAQLLKSSSRGLFDYQELDPTLEDDTLKKPGDQEDPAEEVPDSAKRIKRSVSTTDQSVYDGMSPDALSLLEKIPAGKINGVHYDSRAGRIFIDKETPEKENERITTFQNEYQALLKKLKSVEVPIPATTPLDTVSELVDTYNNQYNMCVFALQEGCVKIVSNSSRQCDQAVTLLTKDIAGKREVIQLPNGRTLTLKKANIVKEEVDIIVNPANGNLSHAGGVAAALDNASRGKLQRLSNDYVRNKGPVQVGHIAVTDGGGDLKCKKVIHAVGPTAQLKEADCKRCINALVRETLKGAEKYNAKSIAFPAISTGIFGVKKELVARCLVDTIVAYKFSKPHPVLSDIRIVIIDDPTYDPFALYCQQKQKELASPIKSRSPIKPSVLKLDKRLNSSPSPSEATGKTATSVKGTPDKKLSMKNDSAIVEGLLKGLASDWQLLGTQLGFSKKTLNKIASAPADDPVYLNRLLMKWLGGEIGSPTVSKLVGALSGIEGAEKYVTNILTAFGDPPTSSLTDTPLDTNSTTSSDSYASAHDGTSPPDDGTPPISYPSLDSTVTATNSWISDEWAVLGNPPPGESSVDRKIPGDKEKPQTSSTSSSQDEYMQLSNQSHGVVSTSSSSWQNMSNSALMSTATNSTSSSQVNPPPPGLTQLPTTHSTLAGHNNGKPWGYPPGQPQGSLPGQPRGYPPGQPRGYPPGQPQGYPPGQPRGYPPGPTGQNGTTNRPGYRAEGSGPRFLFNAGRGANGNSAHHTPRVLGPQGGTPHTQATQSPHSNFGAHQDGGGATAMDHSGAVTDQGMGGDAVTTQPQATTGHAGGGNSTTKDTQDTIKEERDECPICMSDYTDRVKTMCGHDFCRGCIDRSLQQSSFCPICKYALKTIVGNQPLGGQMTVQISRQKLPGYYDCGTIEIHYNIPSGTQTQEHPNPGQWYYGTARTAYLPNNPEGKEVLNLLEKAFKARLIFTVGTSVTTQQDNTIVWNDIHHKTSTHGGPQRYGYPDPGYLRRVKEELAAKGIVPSREATI